MKAKAILREPLLHFLALGALLFLYFEWRGGASGPASTRIVITEGVVANLVSGFTRTWQRPPTPDELKGLVDEHVKEEIATREAIAMGLDRDDTVIRRRLRQKLEFLVDSSENQAAPTDAELQNWLDTHPDVFPAEPRVALRQVFVDTQAGVSAGLAEAERLLVRLRAVGAHATIDALGDPTLLPRELPLGPRSEVARTFGERFAAGIEGLEPGKWGGPVVSAYGLHLVLLIERVAAVRPALADVRPLVQREFLAQRSRKQLEDLYKGLLARYSVTVEMAGGPEKKLAGASTAGAVRP